MKRITLFWPLFFVCITVFTQPVFKTVSPGPTVVIGEAFQIQYVLEGGEANAILQTPEFNGFRITSGPNIYPGKKGLLSLNNYVFSLEATRTGKLIIPGASITSGNTVYRSNPVTVEVISKDEAAMRMNKNGESLRYDYLLRSGEDPYRKIRENLFVKVQVDKSSCLVGEAILATFKLYSRLESKSDIVKNPGFYGFTVYDMAGLSDKLVATEKINGRIYDVHTIRKVQLYPLQAGVFSIDEMELKNRVEFSRNRVNKKTEQQIAEGMLGAEETTTAAEGTEVYETTMHTEPLKVEVKPLPETGKPDRFSGAVGRFRIMAVLPENRLAKNEQGFLEIQISGKGNFTQLDAPLVTWPAGIDGFEPTVNDELDKSASPLDGIRTFRFPFVCASSGQYKIPSVSFSYYDTDSNRYRTVQTAALELEAGVAPEKKKQQVSQELSFEERNEKAARTAGIIAVVLLLLVLGYWIFGSKEKRPVADAGAVPHFIPVAENLLQPLRDIQASDPRTFYRSLHTLIWNLMSAEFGIAGSQLNKQELAQNINNRLHETDSSVKLLSILSTCEAGIYTSASLEEDRESLMQETGDLLKKIGVAI
ncbi:MAG TPA: BatD family protein [Chitinophagaceae bacterium]|jgi:hypothetical protein|nr:BatD family protein [Chitinophagaceae bacterium]